MKNKVILYNAFIFLLLLIALEVTFRLLGFGYENAPLENNSYLHHKNPKIIALSATLLMESMVVTIYTLTVLAEEQIKLSK